MAAAAERYDADFWLGRKRVVLLAEDDAPTRTLVAEFLRANGLSVVEAVNADEAMAVFASNTLVDLVFTDVVMPGSMNGIALAGWVSQHHPHIPILITSAAPEAMSANATNRCFLVKPYELRDIEALIHRLLLGPPDPPKSTE